MRCSKTRKKCTMEKPVYTINKEKKLEKYVQKFNHKKRSLDNGGDKERARSNKYDSKG